MDKKGTFHLMEDTANPDEHENSEINGSVPILFLGCMWPISALLIFKKIIWVYIQSYSSTFVLSKLKYMV